VNKSLKKRMMLALGVSIALTWAVTLASVWVYTSHSQNSIEDNALRAIAVKLLLWIPAGDAAGQDVQLRDEDRADAERLMFQLWQGRDRLVGRTPDAPDTPLRPDFAQGFIDTVVGGETWRVFSVSDRRGSVHAQVGRPRSVVDEHMRNEVLLSLSVFTVLLALAGRFMWGVVRRSLKPIVAVADEVRDRQKFDLAPLPVVGLPKEVRPLVEAFNQLLKQLDQAVQAERRFIGDAAHELRTPLSALYGQAEVALRAATMAEKDAALAKLLAVAERSTRLSEQLLDLARLEAGTHAPQRESYALDQIVVHIASEFDVAAKKANRTLQLATEPCTINCDVDEIGILLRNLVDNALRYTCAGGHIRIACGHATDSKRRVFLEVADDGPGVPPEQRAAIFQRFHRVPGNPARGSGIGLSLVAEIARLHGASIETGDGIGSPGFRVRILFPAVPAESA